MEYRIIENGLNEFILQAQTVPDGVWFTLSTHGTSLRDAKLQRQKLIEMDIHACKRNQVLRVIE